MAATFRFEISKSITIIGIISFNRCSSEMVEYILHIHSSAIDQRYGKIYSGIYLIKKIFIVRSKFHVKYESISKKKNIII